MKNKKLEAILQIILVMVILSTALFVISHCIFLLIPRSNFLDSMATMLTMIFLTIIILNIAKKRSIELSIFPKKFTISYIVFTIIGAILFILTPSNYIGEIKAILLLIYGSIVTPIFEEIIFRGYIWNKLNTVFNKEWKTYAATTILFALWHLGYVGSIALRVQGNLMNIMFWKVVTGFCFGVILGIVRLKTKNCYSTMLMHGIMNIFGR